MNRKDFIKTSLLGAAALSSTPFITYANKSTYRCVLIGSGWWGMNILRVALQSGTIKVTAICDVDDAQLKLAQDEIRKVSSDKPKEYKDFRECIAKEKPEIVINATPDHWHALIAIAAMKSGAHVFLEKPISHTVKEGTAIQKAARDNDRICIVDFHRRYSPHNVSGMNFLKSGKVGKINEVRAFVNYGQGVGTLEEEMNAPAGLDWDMYCGPSKLVNYNPKIHPKGFRFYSEFANGLIGDWGPHWFDQILWWTDEKAPKKIFSSGQGGLKNTHADTWETQLAIFEFEDFHMTWEHNMLNPKKERKTEVWGTYFYGTNGTFFMGWRDGWKYFPNNNDPISEEKAQLNNPDGQNIDLVWADFIKSIESGKLPHADIEHGRQATNMCLLANLSAKIGRSIEWDHGKDMILNDPDANKLLLRNYRGEWEYPV
ncbi:Predicted dehydrogenase [Spirosomataceae bacterium TFI 002]|nr:Predicted dehydrogenase [Spirosomataceae bacterium TFI 002]